MALVDVMDRVQQLRAQLGYTAPAATAAGATGFATALDAARTSAAGPAGGVAVSGTGGVTGDKVVAAARKYLGTPYVFGSTDPARGLDCSSLVQRAYADNGIKLPRIAADQAKVGQPVANLAQAKPGDLICFNNPVDHIAIYVGNGKMIAAPKPGDVVKIQDVYKTPSAIRRVLPETPAVATAPALRPASLQAGAGPVPYADLFNTAATRHGVSPTLLAAVAKVESGYNPRAVSPAGAQGLMQIMPGTARGLGVNALDPAQAVDGAARLLKSNLKEFNGSLPLALAAYNAGGGAVRKYGGIPPYAETQAYVPKVQAAMAALRGKGWP